MTEYSAILESSLNNHLPHLCVFAFLDCLDDFALNSGPLNRLKELGKKSKDPKQDYLEIVEILFTNAVCECGRPKVKKSVLLWMAVLINCGWPYRPDARAVRWAGILIYDP